MRKQLPYFTYNEIVGMIDEPTRSKLQKLVRDNRKRFEDTPGSSNNHQAWPGGYIDHMTEVMNILILLYNRLTTTRPLDFSLSDALIAAFGHDLEKPWKYERGDDGLLHYVPELQEKSSHQIFRVAKFREYGIELTPLQVNGMEYAEGEIHNHSKRERMMSPLAALVHMADIWSARGWFDFPLEKNDPWAEIGRQRNAT